MDHEQKRPWELRWEWVGCLPRAVWPQGGSGTPSLAPHTAWHAYLRPLQSPAGVPTFTMLGARLPQSPAHPQTGTPWEKREPSHCFPSEGDTAQQRARHILQVLPTQRSWEREGRGGPGGAWTPPGTPASCLCYWARDPTIPGQREGRTDR